MNTDNLSSVLAALDAKKLPSQNQIDAYLSLAQRFFQRADQEAGSLSQNPNSGDVGRLSEHGSVLARDVVEILESYKVLGQEKNHDDLVQDAFWNLSQSEVNVNANVNAEGLQGTASKQEVKSDAQALASSLQNLGKVFIGNISDEGSPLLAELLSFLRLSLADAAEGVEGVARATKENLRGVEDEVQKGDRDALGRKKPELKEGETTDDPRIKFEQRMDAAKYAGSNAIGTGQQAKQTTLQYKDTTKSKVLDAFDNVLRRAQGDPEYNSALSTIFDVLGKWVTKPLDLADSAPDKISKEDNIVEDPSGRLPEAFRQLNTVLERLAGGKSTQNLHDTVRIVRDDIRDNSELRQLVSDANTFVHRGLEDSQFAESEQFDSQKDDLMNRWRTILNAETPESKKLKTDMEALQRELEAFQEAIQNDAALNRLKVAMEKFGKDLAKAAADGAVMSQTSIPWIWKDILNVYLPLALEYVKGIPIPRTEYKDDDVEFVVEDLSIESLQLLPGHAHLSTTVNMDVDKPSGAADAKSDTSTKTSLKLTGLQMTLKEVSFWYNDPSLKLASEVKGLMDITLPARGVDAEATLGLIPTASGKKRRERRGGFHEVSNVHVNIASDTSITLKKTNHQVLISVFKPVVKKQLISTIEKLLAEKIRLVLEMVDGIAWDVYQRAGVFQDAGLTATGPKYIAAMMSEWGKLRQEPGLLSGWTMTSVGMVKDDPRSDTLFAVGAAPQIISGDKHGPRTTATSTNAARDTVNSAKDTAKDAKPDISKGAIKDTAVGAVGQVKSFKATVDTKAAEEKKRDGWRSSAFDLK